MKKLNTKFLSQIIKSELFILEKTNSKKINYLSIFNSNSLKVLDVVGINTFLKQFIRLLQFVIKNKIIVNFITSNNNSANLLSFILKSKNSMFRVNTLRINNMQIFNYSCLFIFLSEQVNLKNKLLVSEISLNLTKLNAGTYKFFNSFNSFKKLIFFISILKTISKVQKFK